MDGMDVTTWWKRCYEGLRGARFVSPFIFEFSLAVVVLGWVVFVCLFVCLLCFDFASENSAFN